MRKEEKEIEEIRDFRFRVHVPYWSEDLNLYSFNFYFFTLVRFLLCNSIKSK